MNPLLQYIDLIWLPIGFLAVHKEQRLVTIAFFISCFLMMRLQVEMMVSLGFETGFLPLIKWHVQNTALVVYMLFYVAYLAIAHWSPGSDKHIFLAASISIFFAALFTSMIIMLL